MARERCACGEGFSSRSALGCSGTDERALAAYRLTFGASLAAATANAIFGTILAWVLVRYRFPGKRFVAQLGAHRGANLPDAQELIESRLLRVRLAGPSPGLSQSHALWMKSNIFSVKRPPISWTA